MEKQDLRFYWKWCLFIMMTLFCLFSFYNSYHIARCELQEESQALFQQVVKEDTDRRIKELGNDFCFSYSGANRLERDTITIMAVDTIIHINNNKDVARRMSSQEKTDFCLQLFLSMENPIKIASLDSAFRLALHELSIPAHVATRYTFIDKTVYSVKDTSLCQSFIPLKEVVFGPNRTMVLQAFVQFPFLYIVGEVISQNTFWILVIIIFLVVVVFLTRKRPGISVLPLNEPPIEVLQIADDILFDETHGVLHYHGHRIELVNQRLKLFCVLLEHKGNFIDSDKLKCEIWPDGSVSKDALSTTVKRLKNDIQPVSELTIESARGRGYRLNIS